MKAPDSITVLGLTVHGDKRGDTIIYRAERFPLVANVYYHHWNGGSVSWHVCAPMPFDEGIIWQGGSSSLAEAARTIDSGAKGRIDTITKLMKRAAKQAEWYRQ